MEFIPLSSRTLVGTTWFTLDAFTLVFTAMYYLFSEDKSWMVPALIGYGFAVYGVIGSLMLPESPKWLIEQKRYSDARDSLQTIANWNRKTLNFDAKSIDHAETYTETAVEVKPLSFWLSQRRIATNLFLMTIIWFVTSFDYYLIMFLVAEFKRALETTIVSQLSEMVATAFSGVLLEMIGPQKSLSCSFGISCLGGLAVTLYGL